MDTAAMIASRASTEVLKEPRGFIKFIQIGLAIFAFATTTAYVGSTAFTFQCPGKSLTTSEISFSYPFVLNQELTYHNSCHNATSNEPDKAIYGDYKSSSEFYVFVGVTAFLYSLGILIFYVFGDELYRTKDIIPTVDFVVTAVYALLWLISSSAWADGVSKVKYYTNPKELWQAEYVCECANASGRGQGGCEQATDCKVTNEGNYATLNVSIIFGFLCMAVWAGNLWFLYKETKWFKNSAAADTEGVTTSQASSPGSMPSKI